MVAVLTTRWVPPTTSDTAWSRASRTHWLKVLSMGQPVLEIPQYSVPYEEWAAMFVDETEEVDLCDP